MPCQLQLAQYCDADRKLHPDPGIQGGCKGDKGLCLFDLPREVWKYGSSVYSCLLYLYHFISIYSVYINSINCSHAIQRRQRQDG